MSRSHPRADRTLRVLGRPPYAREAWQHLTRAVRDGAPKGTIAVLRAKFSDALKGYE